MLIFVNSNLFICQDILVDNFENILTQVHVFNIFYFLNFIIEVSVHFVLDFIVLPGKVSQDLLLQTRLLLLDSQQFENLLVDLFQGLTGCGCCRFNRGWGLVLRRRKGFELLLWSDFMGVLLFDSFTSVFLLQD